MDQDHYWHCVNEENDLKEQLEMYEREFKASNYQDETIRISIRTIIKGIVKVQETQREIRKRIETYLGE